MVSIKNKIIGLLTKEDLTSAEIFKKLKDENLEIDKDKIWVSLNTLNHENKVVRITDKKPYLYKAITPLALLKQLYDIMENKMDFVKSAVNEDLELLKTIKEVIK